MKMINKVWCKFYDLQCSFYRVYEVGSKRALYLSFFVAAVVANPSMGLFII